MMQTTETIWQNGKFIPWDQAKVHVLTHALHYGGGAFEGIRFYNTPQGPAIFRLDDHIERLFYSMEVLKMPFSYSKEEVRKAIIEVVLRNKLPEGYIRPIAFYGYKKMGVNPVGNPVEFVIACWPWGAYLPYESVDVKTSRYIHLHPDSIVVDAKLCGHYINGIMASLELQGTHYHEALFLDSDGYITEGVGENFFMIKDGVLYTPKSGGILLGLTRDTLFKLAQSLKLEVKEADISLPDLYLAHEAFFSGTAAEITAIQSVNDRRFGAGGVGPITAEIKKAYLELVHGKNTEFISYLTYVNPERNQ